MIFKDKFRSAFTMLEVVFVTVILGIVASIGAELIAKTYEGYIMQRALHNASIRTELAATQIVNRLTYAIPNTVIARQTPALFSSINSAPNKNFNILEWIGYDADSFEFTGPGNTPAPGWSGFADIDNAANTNTALSTPASALATTNAIIANLSAAPLIPRTIADAAILFPGPNTYNIGTLGYSGSVPGASNISQLTVVAAGTTLDFIPTPAGITRLVKEHYKLAWSAYAIVPIALNAGEIAARGLNGVDNLFDLELRYNFQPWNGVFYNAGNAVSILVRNVSVFNFIGTGNTIRFKLCTQESIGGNIPVMTCKEKAVVR